MTQISSHRTDHITNLEFTIAVNAQAKRDIVDKRKENVSDEFIHESRSVLKKLNMLEIIKAQFDAKEKSDMLQVMQRVHDIDVLVTNQEGDATEQSLDLSTLDDEQLNQVYVRHPYTLLEQHEKLSQLQICTLLYGTPNLGTLPNGLSNTGTTGTTIPLTVSANDLAIVLNRAQQLRALSNRSLNGKLDQEPVRKTDNLSSSMAKFLAGNNNSSVPLSPESRATFIEEVTKAANMQAAGSIGDFGFNRTVVQSIDKRIEETSPNSKLGKPATNVLHRTSLGARLDVRGGSANSDSNGYKSVAQREHERKVAAAASLKPVTVLDEDPDTTTSYFTHRSQFPLPSASINYVSLCSRDFTQALAFDYLKVSALEVDYAFWHGQVAGVPRGPPHVF